MSDVRLRALYALGVEQRSTGDRAACAPPDRILAAAERRGPAGERHATLEHVMSCPFCRADFELLRSIADAPPRPAPSRSTLASLGTVAVLAAAGIALLARGVPRRESPPPDVERGGAGAATIALAPAGEVPRRAPIALTWREVPDAIGYDVELLTADGALLLAVQTRDTTIAVADSLTAAPGQTYRWWVRARLRNGTSVTTAPVAFRRAAGS